MSKNIDRIAIVTGATGGIGFQVAKKLGQEGYTVILNGIDDEAGVKRVDELKKEGINAEYFGFDVTNEDAVNSNIKNIGDKFGKIDVLVNNAGGLGGRQRFEEMTTEFYRFVRVARTRTERSIQGPPGDLEFFEFTFFELGKAVLHFTAQEIFSALQVGVAGKNILVTGNQLFCLQ
mgnify:CR=1 FL=1